MRDSGGGWAIAEEDDFLPASPAGQQAIRQADGGGQIARGVAGRQVLQRIEERLGVRDKRDNHGGIGLEHDERGLLSVPGAARLRPGVRDGLRKARFTARLRGLHAGAGIEEDHRARAGRQFALKGRARQGRYDERVNEQVQQQRKHVAQPPEKRAPARFLQRALPEKVGAHGHRSPPVPQKVQQHNHRRPGQKPYGPWLEKVHGEGGEQTARRDLECGSLLRGEEV